MYLIKRNSVYYIRYFDESENRLKQLSTSYKVKSDALRFLTNFKAELRDKQKPTFRTLDKFSKEYLSQIKILHSNKYYILNQDTFNKLFTFIDKNSPLVKLNITILQDYLFEKYKTSPYSASLDYRILRTAFNYAVSKNYLTENPLLKFRLPKIPEKINLYINEDEFQLIIDKTESSTLKDLFSFAYNTGMRLSEIINLRWSSVSFNDGLIKVESDETFRTKNNKSRIIPINKTLLDILTNRIPKVIDITKDVFVFTKDNRRFNPDYVSKQFKKSVRAAKLNDAYHFHILRGSFISNLAKRNVPLVAIQKIAGHSNIRITEKHYLTVQNDLLTSAMKTLDSSIGAVKNG